MFIQVEKDSQTNKYQVTPNATPSGGGATAYGWNGSGNTIWTNFDIPPETVTDEKMLVIDGEVAVRELLYDPVGYGVDYTKISDTSFSLGNEAETITYTRDGTSDFTLWELS